MVTKRTENRSFCVIGIILILMWGSSHNPICGARIQKSGVRSQNKDEGDESTCFLFVLRGNKRTNDVTDHNSVTKDDSLLIFSFLDTRNDIVNGNAL